MAADSWANACRLDARDRTEDSVIKVAVVAMLRYTVHFSAPSAAAVAATVSVLGADFRHSTRPRYLPGLGMPLSHRRRNHCVTRFGAG